MRLDVAAGIPVKEVARMHRTSAQYDSNAWGMLSYKVTQGQGPRTPMSVMQLRVAVDVPTHTAKLGPSVATTSAG